MKLERIPYEPAAAIDFFEEGLSALGALCDRTWHDRLEIIAERQAAKLWNEQGDIHSTELKFGAVESNAARDAAHEIFPGCPLTFRLAETLRPAPLTLERIVLADPPKSKAPDAAVAEKLWRLQFPETVRWKQLEPFKASHHFTLLALVRTEIQAIDQHWSLRRIAMALPGGELDSNLANEFAFFAVNNSPPAVSWPSADPANWQELLRKRLETELAEELQGIRLRQEKSLRKELDRIDDYFEKYELELSDRSAKSSNQTTKSKTSDRLAAAKAEHQRRRADQAARHEIRVHPHFDSLLLIAESAWKTTLQIDRNHQSQKLDATFVPRSRRWHLA